MQILSANDSLQCFESHIRVVLL